MSPKVFEAFSQILASFYNDRFPSAALEVGASAQTLFAILCLEKSRKAALNAQKIKKLSPELQKCERVIDNSNSLEFSDKEFDCVLSSYVLKHDKYFWKSVE